MRKQQEQTGQAEPLTEPAGQPTEKPTANRALAARTWFARAAVGVVFLLNVTCALQFIIWPEGSAPAYGLPPTPESYALVAGMGVAFLMWNCTYPPVIANPLRFRLLFAVVLVQQVVGLVGESVIWWQLANAGLADGAMAHGIMRFVAFDAAGLLLMLAAFLASRSTIQRRKSCHDPRHGS